MLTRYHKGPDGRPVKRALVYTAAEHGIKKRDLDQDAVRVVQKLQESGHDAYIVGGAVRDLLLGRHPKDYDIVTDAPPQRIRKLFYRSRIIGRRFRLVHVYAGPKIFEVSTFRSISNGTIGNEYGSIDEDARRRDFSLNALYYDPLANTVVDYVHGMQDIKARKIVPIIPLKSIFVEDPVRMLRAIKYATLTGFSLTLGTRMAIRRNAGLLATASTSRLGEEASKIFTSANCLAISESLVKYRLASAILPGIGTILSSGGPQAERLRTDLGELDAYIHRSGDKTLSVLLTYILPMAVEAAAAQPAADAGEAYKNALQAARDFLYPVTLPRVEVEKAVRSLFVAPEAKKAARKPRKRRRKRRSGDRPADSAPDAAGLDT